MRVFQSRACEALVEIARMIGEAGEQAFFRMDEAE